MNLSNRLKKLRGKNSLRESQPFAVEDRKSAGSIFWVENRKNKRSNI
jgi:hypothetical protein